MSETYKHSTRDVESAACTTPWHRVDREDLGLGTFQALIRRCRQYRSGRTSRIGVPSQVNTDSKIVDDLVAPMGTQALEEERRIRSLQHGLAKHSVIPCAACATCVIVAQGLPSFQIVELGIVALDETPYVVISHCDTVTMTRVNVDT
jgi:hypothetical protein